MFINFQNSIVSQSVSYNHSNKNYKYRILNLFLQKMQNNQLNWLHNKKAILLNQLLQFQTKSHDIYQQQKFFYKNAETDLKQQLKNKQLNCKQKEQLIRVMQKQIQQLQIMILKNQKTQQDMNNKIQTFTIQNRTLKGEFQKITFKCSTIQEKYQKLEAKYQQKLKQAQAQHQKIVNNQEISLEEIKTKYESLIIQKQKSVQRKYESILEQIKIQNRKILQNIQKQYGKQHQNKSQNFKKYQTDNIRLINQNTKQLAQINQLKMKLVDGQTQNNSISQQLRLRKKQSQLTCQNLKKQIQFYKENQKGLKLKNKNLNQKAEELAWSLREQQLKQKDQLNKIKKQLKKEMDEFLEKAESEVLKIKNQNGKLKDQIDTKEKLNKLIANSKGQAQQKLIQLKLELQRRERKDKQKNQQTADLRSLQRQLLEARQLLIKKKNEFDVLQEQIKRLKQKCNKVTSAYQDQLKARQIMENQNKMLLSQIIFLRQKKSKGGKGEIQRSEMFNSNILDMRSEQSKQEQDVEQYKNAIKQMNYHMQQTLQKVMQKDQLIAKQKVMIERMQKLIAYG